MAKAMTFIASLSGGASTIDFTSIPSTYTDLLLVQSLRFSTASGIQNVWIRFNNDSGTNYSQLVILGEGSTVNTYKGTSQNAYLWTYAPGGAGTTTANTYSNAALYIPNYANTSHIKYTSLDLVAEVNSTTNNSLDIHHGSWNSTSAINRITLTAPSDTFTSASTAYLYGINNS
jgi:hypothetical protein